MTLVVTTVSKNGITVVGDKAATWPHGDGIATNVNERKIFLSRVARISVAIWGSTRWPGGKYSEWVGEFVETITREEPLSVTAERFCSDANSRLHEGFGDHDRRGAHFAGFVGGVPHIYHVHTGKEDKPQHELTLFRDYPD